VAVGAIGIGFHFGFGVEQDFVQLMDAFLHFAFQPFGFRDGPFKFSDGSFWHRVDRSTENRLLKTFSSRSPAQSPRLGIGVSGHRQHRQGFGSQLRVARSLVKIANSLTLPAWDGPGKIPWLRNQQPSRSVESLSGLIEGVTFHNEENGFAVLKVKAKGIATWSLSSARWPRSAPESG
jgi:hypothetical protein